MERKSHVVHVERLEKYNECVDEESFSNTDSKQQEIIASAAASEHLLRNLFLSVFVNNRIFANYFRARTHGLWPKENHWSGRYSVGPADQLWQTNKWVNIRKIYATISSNTGTYQKRSQNTLVNCGLKVLKYRRSGLLRPIPFSIGTSHLIVHTTVGR